MLPLPSWLFLLLALLVGWLFGLLVLVRANSECRIDTVLCATRTLHSSKECFDNREYGAGPEPAVDHLPARAEVTHNATEGEQNDDGRFGDWTALDVQRTFDFVLYVYPTGIRKSFQPNPTMKKLGGGVLWCWRYCRCWWWCCLCHAILRSAVH